MINSNEILEKAKNKNVDIVFLTLPRLELRTPITAPALLKACVEQAGFHSLCIDLNIDLWHQLDSTKYGHIWFDTDLTFRYKEKFLSLWEEAIEPCAQRWIEVLKKIDPQWIGMTVFSQRSRWIIETLCQLIKTELPHINIVLGGPYSEFVSPSLFEKKIADAYVIGEGEVPIVKILRGNFDYPGINGTPAIQNNDINEIPIPDYSDFFFKNYPSNWVEPRVRDLSNMGSNSIYITGSRGCVRKCEFCDIQSIWPKFRFRSGENIAEEMRLQNQKHKSRRFLFTDSLLNGSVKQLKELCETLIEYKKRDLIGNVQWQGQFIARPKSQMSEEIYALMKDAGCAAISIGVESGSEKVRRDMKKNFDDEALDYTFRSCAKNGIAMSWLLLVGYPTETEEDFEMTLNFLDRYYWIKEMDLVKSVVLGPTLDIVKGSPLYNNQNDLGIYWDEFGNWVMNKNNRVCRIKRWLKLKEKSKQLGYAVTEKTTDHLLLELEQYENSPQSKPPKYSLSSSPLGSMDQGE